MTATCRAFDDVFLTTAQLHGFGKAGMTAIPAATYRQHLANGPSPASLKAPRAEAILMVDAASDSQALVKVRVRISSVVYVDYLNYHRIDAGWRITAKSFHVEARL